MRSVSAWILLCLAALAARPTPLHAAEEGWYPVKGIKDPLGTLRGISGRVQLFNGSFHADMWMVGDGGTLVYVAWGGRTPGVRVTRLTGANLNGVIFHYPTEVIVPDIKEACGQLTSSAAVCSSCSAAPGQGGSTGADRRAAGLLLIAGLIIARWRLRSGPLRPHGSPLSCAGPRSLLAWRLLRS